MITRCNNDTRFVRLDGHGYLLILDDARKYHVKLWWLHFICTHGCNESVDVGILNVWHKKENHGFAIGRTLV